MSTPETAEGIVNGAGLSLPEKVSVATQLVQLALDHYTLGRTPGGEAYAVPRTGPGIARMLKGSQRSLRADLARRYHAQTGRAAPKSALSDALEVLQGRADLTDPVEAHLRVGRHGDALVLDLGDESGRCVVVTDEGWTIEPSPPVRFRRTAPTGALPEPELAVEPAEVKIESFDALWPLLNVREEYRPVLLAVLVAELVPDIPHPVVVIDGEQGCGKTSASALIANVLDPSPAPVRRTPKDIEQWVVAASGSWFVALDNLSGVPEWLSDAICRASTGDGDVRRALYADGELVVFAFRRCVLINGVSLNSLRPDLLDRAVRLPLERIPDEQRREDKEVTREWRAAHPSVLGALLSLASRVLRTLPTVELERPPRMADFARVLTAVDAVLGTNGMGTYLDTRDESARETASTDPVLVELERRVTRAWRGTAADLLELITPQAYRFNPPRDWPRTSRALTTALTRQAPTLRRVGWEVENLGRVGDPRGKATAWRLVPPGPRFTLRDFYGQPLEDTT